MHKRLQGLSSILKNTSSISYADEPTLLSRLETINRQFGEKFSGEAEVIVRSPGRAEILGNHTDYNKGYALSCAISRSTIAFLSKRSDESIHIASTAFTGTPVVFSINALKKASEASWANYARGVVRELIGSGTLVGGANILIDSNVPSSGGVSSSAALELAICVGLSTLYGHPLDLMKVAMLSKQAENGPLVGTPCGFLDQASSAFGQSGQMVLLDFDPKGLGLADVQAVPTDLKEKGFSFVIAVDPEVKRNLGETGYPARRKMCEDSLPVIGKLLGRTLASLRDLSVLDFQKIRGEIEKQGGQVMRMRVEHIVYENQRVLDGVMALENGDVELFGQILTASGHSALELYGLDEKTPELTFLVEKGRALPVVLGSRNMGGGFSAISLSLVKSSDVATFEQELGGAYRAKWGRALQFIDFQLTQGVEVL